MKAIGLMGDGFDPIHLGHLEAALRAKDELQLNEILFLVYGDTCHTVYLASQPEREEMLRLAVRDIPGFALCPVSAEGGDAFSPDTLRALHAIYADTALWHIVDDEMIARLATRADIADITPLCSFLVIQSGDSSRRRDAVKALRGMGARVKCARLREVDATTARVRDALSRGKNAKRLLPADVSAYIAQRHLYGPLPEHLLPGWMDAKRWKHTLGVVDTALSLAQTFGEDVRKTRMAALLHDSAKCMSFGEMLVLCDRHKLELTDLERSRRALLHGPAGMCLAMERFFVTDDDLLNAIRYHTTGRERMSRLELIIYLADAIEPTRHEYPGLTDIRAMAVKDLKRAALMCMQRSVEYVNQQRASLAPATADAIAWLGGQIIKDSMIADEAHSQMPSTTNKKEDPV